METSSTDVCATLRIFVQPDLITLHGLPLLLFLRDSWLRRWRTGEAPEYHKRQQKE